MYVFNARLKFKIPAISTPIPGSIIAASAISAVDLERRQFKKYSHLNHRLLDPQLYMAAVDPALDAKTVQRLAAYPWFHGQDVPKYDSGEHKTRTAWKKTQHPTLISKWTRTIPTSPDVIYLAAREAVKFQVTLGCDGILLAGPLTTLADQTLQPEMTWLEAGLQACKELNVSAPIYATIAISEALLHVPPLNNPLIHSFSNLVAANADLAGAYIVLEQTDAGSYFWTAKDPLMSLVILVDDLCRGAKKKVIVNYAGTFGLLLEALGAVIWSSGYFLNQRRFSLKAQMGIAHPRYHSLPFAGDIGLKEDMVRLRDAGLSHLIMTPTAADAVLRSALTQGKGPSNVPEWKYAPNNVTAAQTHYLEVAAAAGAMISAMPLSNRVDWVFNWLKNAVQLVQEFEQKELLGMSTDTHHQRVWFDVFRAWRDYAKL